ncbi:MAG: GIY-YIG nuclease family protein [Thaumarchaeota archaeon]|nr:GIY-YIG nuclease family protein [Nitrososphaerota archaeon]
MWQVYMVRCRTGELYTGCTVDLERRIEQHNSGSGSKFTRSRRPVVLVFSEECESRSSALKREIQIKRMSRAQKVRLAQTASATSA